MTPTELNLAIAKKRGWKVHPKNKWCVIPPKSPHSVQRLSTLPNFVGDLNLMHDMEATLDKEQRRKWEFIIAEMFAGLDKSWFDVCHMNALQRAEAYAKVRGICHD